MVKSRRTIRVGVSCCESQMSDENVPARAAPRGLLLEQTGKPSGLTTVSRPALREVNWQRPSHGAPASTADRFHKSGYEALRALDEECNWRDRTEVITRDDHRLLTEFARELVQEMSDTAADLGASAAAAADGMSGEQSRTAGVDPVSSAGKPSNDGGADSDSEYESASELDGVGSEQPSLTSLVAEPSSVTSLPSEARCDASLLADQLGGLALNTPGRPLRPAQPAGGGEVDAVDMGGDGSKNAVVRQNVPVEGPGVMTKVEGMDVTETAAGVQEQTLAASELLTASNYDIPANGAAAADEQRPEPATVDRPVSPPLPAVAKAQQLEVERSNSPPLPTVAKAQQLQLERSHSPPLPAAAKVQMDMGRSGSPPLPVVAKAQQSESERASSPLLPAAAKAQQMHVERSDSPPLPALVKTQQMEAERPPSPPLPALRTELKRSNSPPFPATANAQQVGIERSNSPSLLAMVKAEQLDSERPTSPPLPAVANAQQMLLERPPSPPLPAEANARAELQHSGSPPLPTHAQANPAESTDAQSAPLPAAAESAQFSERVGSPPLPAAARSNPQRAGSPPLPAARSQSPPLPAAARSGSPPLPAAGGADPAAFDDEDLPIPPKKGYNLDFLDDPDFDPFNTGKTLQLSPPGSPGQGRKQEEKLPAKPATKPAARRPLKKRPGGAPPRGKPFAGKTTATNDSETVKDSVNNVSEPVSSPQKPTEPEASKSAPVAANTNNDEDVVMESQDTAITEDPALIATHNATDGTAITAKELLERPDERDVLEEPAAGVASAPSEDSALESVSRTADASADVLGGGDASQCSAQDTGLSDVKSSISMLDTALVSESLASCNITPAGETATPESTTEGFVPASDFFQGSALDELFRYGDGRLDSNIARNSLFIRFDPLLGRPSVLPQIQRLANTRGDTALGRQTSAARHNLIEFGSMPGETQQQSDSAAANLARGENNNEATDSEAERLRQHNLSLENQLLKSNLKVKNLEALITTIKESSMRAQQTAERYSAALAAISVQVQALTDSRDERYRNLATERDEARQEVANIEAMFSDLHRKYERCKQELQQQRQLGDQLAMAQRQSSERADCETARYDLLQNDAEQALERLRTENLRLTMKLRLSDNKISKLEDDNQQLTNMCDELIQKMGAQH